MPSRHRIRQGQPLTEDGAIDALAGVVAACIDGMVARGFPLAGVARALLEEATMTYIAAGAVDRETWMSLCHNIYDRAMRAWEEEEDGQ